MGIGEIRLKDSITNAGSSQFLWVYVNSAMWQNTERQLML